MYMYIYCMPFFSLAITRDACENKRAVACIMLTSR